MRNSTHRASLAFVMSLLSSAAYGADPAPMTYLMPNGKSASVLLMTGVRSDGKPLVSSYIGPDGKAHSPLVQAQICSVDSGTPYLCAAESASNAALILSDSGAPTSSGTWPTSDPLVAGQAWQNGGVMMLSTGSAAKPTFDGSGLANVATLNSSGQVTAPIATTAASSTGALAITSSSASLTGNVSGTTKKWTLGRRSQDTYTALQSYNGSAWQYLALNDDGSIDTSLGYVANLGADAPFAGTVSAKTLSASTSAFVPDVAVNNSSTSALNTESADKRYIAITDASNFIDSTTLSKYVDRATIASTYLTQTDAASTYATLSALTSYLTTTAAASTYAPLASPALTGTPTSTTPATTDNSTAIATTAFVNNAFQSIEYSSQGDISTAGSSIQVSFGTSGLYAKFAYTGSGSASMTFCSSSGTLSPVDIRRNSIWGGSGVETYTLDNGSVGTGCVTADSTVYTQSQDSSAYFIRVGGTVYFLTVWASNNGARAFMGVHKMI